MTQEDIIRMAREAGLYTKCEVHSAVPFDQLLERFAALVAAAEREECAKLAEQFEPNEKTDYVTYASTAIRARGNSLS